MKKTLLLSTVMFVLLTGIALGNDGDKYTLGNKVADFTLKDLTDKEFELEKVLARDDVKGVVFMFISTTCPVSKACDTRYVQMASDFREKGIVFVG